MADCPPLSGSSSQEPTASHLARRYGYCALFFSVLTVAALFTAYHRGGLWHPIALLGLWLSACAGLLAHAYSENDASAFGKESDGTMPPIFLWGCLPYALPLRLRQWVLTHLSKEPAYQELLPGIYLGRRPNQLADLPHGVTTVVDLAAEFPFPQTVRETLQNYVSFPILEASTRPFDELCACIDSLPTSGLYIHCAQGHGRTGFFACAFLLRKHLASSFQDAVSRVTTTRPGIRLRHAQAAFLQTVVIGQ